MPASRAFPDSWHLRTMDSPTPDHDLAASEVFANSIAHRERGEHLDFDDFCSRQPMERQAGRCSQHLPLP